MYFVHQHTYRMLSTYVEDAFSVRFLDFMKLERGKVKIHYIS